MKAEEVLMKGWIESTARIVNDREDADRYAEDLVQEGWAIALEAREKYDPESDMSLQNWVILHLRRDMVRWLENERKHADGHDVVEDFLEVEDFEPFVDIDAEERLSNQYDLHKLLETLPERDAKILELLIFEDMSEQEVAVLEGVSRSMIRKIRDRAVAKLQQQVG